MTETAVKHHQAAPHRGDQSPWLAMSIPWTIPYISAEHTDLLHGVVWDPSVGAVKAGMYRSLSGLVLQYSGRRNALPHLGCDCTGRACPHSPDASLD